MIQRSLHFSSKQKIGISKSRDFTVKFNPVLKLSSNMNQEMAVSKILITYSTTIMMVVRIGKQSLL